MNITVLLYAGIVLITGLLFGKVAKAIHMPNVTGYLVGGLLIGPSLIGILSEEAITSLSLVSNVALGFIAFSIGNELKVSYFKKVGTGPIVIAIFESFFAILFVFAAFLVYFAIVGQFTLANIRFSLVLSAIAAATAPAATLMVVRQYKAKGTLTDTLLSVVAIDDATAIIFFGIFVAISNMLGNTVATPTPIILQILEPIWEIFLSIGIGGIIGLILVLACKWFTGRGNRISLVVAAIFMTIYLTTVAGGSALLACMALGGIFANLSSHYDDVNGLVYFITPPIFIMFFVVSGADLKISVLAIVGMVGVLYVLFRVGGKIFGAWFGAKATIGLSLVATQVLNAEMGSMIRAIILCATLIYELTGPIITKITLRKAGEITIQE